MILGDVEETITTVEIDDETYDGIIKASTPGLPAGTVLGQSTASARARAPHKYFLDLPRAGDKKERAVSLRSRGWRCASEPARQELS